MFLYIFFNMQQTRKQIFNCAFRDFFYQSSDLRFKIIKATEKLGFNHFVTAQRKIS